MMLSVRTTLTIEDKIAEAIEAHRRDHGLSLKKAINQLLREGLKHYEAIDVEPRPYRTRTHALRLRPGIDPNKLHDLLDEIDIEDARRTLEL